MGPIYMYMLCGVEFIFCIIKLRLFFFSVASTTYIIQSENWAEPYSVYIIYDIKSAIIYTFETWILLYTTFNIRLIHSHFLSKNSCLTIINDPMLGKNIILHSTLNMPLPYKYYTYMNLKKSYISFSLWRPYIYK